MSVKILSENIKSKQLLPLYYIYGEEEYLKRYYYSEIKRLGASDLPEFNFAEFEGKGFSFDEFANYVDSYPVMADHKVIGLIDIDAAFLKTNVGKEFVDFISTIPDYCTVVIMDTDLKQSSSEALLKAVEKAGGVAAEVDRPPIPSLVTWIKRHFKSHGKEISTEDVHYLLEIADNDMLSLNNEISKLCGYISETTVKRSDIDGLVTKSIDANRFELADAFYSKNYNKIFDILDKLYKQNIDDIVIANVFYSTFLDMWRACLAFKSGKTSNDLASDFEIHRYGAAKAMKNTRNIKKSFLQAAVGLACNLDKQLKSAPFNKRDLVMAFVADVIERRQGNG